MNKQETILKAFQEWYSSLKSMKQYGERPAKGTIAASLIVLERIKGSVKLELNDHLAKGGAQISGLSLSALRKILERFGETRDFPSEGGRTNRGNNTPIRQLLACLKGADIQKLSSKDRSTIIDQMQSFLVESLDAYYLLERIRFDFSPDKPARNIVASILEISEARGQNGPVAQHLIGAKLQLRFPKKEISNRPFSAADDQSGHTGDFHVGQTAFHVTVAPSLGHVDRCKQNLRQGVQVFLIVPQAKTDKARILLDEKGLGNRVAVESIESFVGQNISEMAEFTPKDFIARMNDFLRMYNERVRRVETDLSLLIEVPAGLERLE